MILSRIWALTIVISTVTAFKDASPFFLFSTSELLASSSQLASATSLSKTLASQLEKCPSDTYVIVSQPGVSAADYHDRRSASHLRMMMRGDDKNIRSSLAVKDVLGAMDAEVLSNLVQEKCEAGHLRIDASTGSFAIADDMKPRVISLDFPPLPADSGRALKLAENDAFLASVLDLLPSTKYTVLYTTTPNPTSHPQHDESYEIDSLFQAPIYTELKRDFANHKRASDEITLPDGPLFERYSFLSPGLFMGIFVMIILLYILYVGISAVASLQISYAAFDRDMGPTAQKKQG